VIAVRDRGRSDARRVTLLAGQAFALGLLMAWIMIPAGAIFLSTYGSDLLPVTYIGAALAGVVGSASLSAALRRRPLANVARRVLIATSAVLVVAWLLLSSGALWPSFALLVLVPIVVPMGFMLLVGQAGMLLDVRALKALYARVIAGFALGFVAGGLAGPPLLAVLGPTENLLLGAAAAGALWVALLALTRRQFPVELAGVERDDVDPDALPTWGALLRHRYVMLIVAFQMLSAVESQWLDYLVFARAAARYQDSEELARFISRFSAIAYGADILFLLLVAGFLLRRFGLRYGLAANPGAVLALVSAVVVLSALQGAGATVVFVLVVAARVTDLVLADGAARTSLSAAYQVVPTPLRLAAQAGVEGMAVPLAIGASGIVLLALQATVGTGGIVLPVLVGAVVGTWLVVAVLVHRSYRTSLLTSLRFRTLDPAALAIDDANSLAVADRLLASDDLRDVRLGLDTLAHAGHPALRDRLLRLIEDDRMIVRVDALHRLSLVDVEAAAAAAHHGLDDPDPVMRAAAVRVLTVHGDPSATPALVAHDGDPDPDVRVAVLAALADVGGAEARTRVAAELVELSASTDPSDRALAARVLAISTGIADRSLLAALVVDRDDAVAVAALDATRGPVDHACIELVAGRLGARATASAAAHALVRVGEPALALVDDGLAADVADRRVQELLVRVARDIGGPPAIAVLGRHLSHPDREVGLAVLTALGALVSAAQREGWAHEPVDASRVVLADIEHATRTVRAAVVCGQVPEAHVLRTALRDELDLLRRRVLAGLASRYGSEPLERVAFQLANGDGRSHALAVEWLDVTLTGMDRAALPLLEPGLAEAERLRRLTRSLPLPDLPLAEVLWDIVADPEARWREPWVQACALHAAWAVPDVDLDVLVGGLARSSSIVDETVDALRSRVGGAGLQGVR
jgi:HEAT repeat protein